MRTVTSYPILNSSSRPIALEVAHVSQDGFVTAQGSGFAIVAVTSGGLRRAHQRRGQLTMIELRPVLLCLVLVVGLLVVQRRRLGPACPSGRRGHASRTCRYR